jgi:hypothetical protein
MTATLAYITDHLPRVTAKDLRRFSTSAKIQDTRAFVAELQAFVHERVEAVKLPTSLEVPMMEQSLARKAAALRTSTRWVPGETDIQRGRAALLESFEQPQNLSLPEFARLAGKSRQQIYKDIEAQRLLALNVGPRGQKLPDWQLDPVKQQLTQTVLQRGGNIDCWTLYRALSEPLEGLRGRSPVEAVTSRSIEDMARSVLNVLGVH